MKGLDTFRRILFVPVACCFILAGTPALRAGDCDANTPAPGCTAKNIILLIADGCGYNHIAAADFYEYGQTGLQVYEDFPIQFAMSTYAVGGGYDPNLAWQDFDYVMSGATDSAASATAIATGIKTYSGRLNIDTNGNAVMNVAERAELLGKATGVVTTVPFSHSTPAGFAAHNISRDNFGQIAEEMIYDSALDVIMGTGHPAYNNNGGQRRPANFTYFGKSQTFLDVFNGTAGADADGIDDPWVFISTLQEFRDLAAGPAPKRLFGLPQVFETLQQRRSGSTKAAPFQVPLTATVPALDEMTRAALNVLDDDPDGFFVMIEGGAIDWTGHQNQAGRLIEEMLDFNRAVRAVVDWVETNSDWNQTIVMVTADHETGYITGPGSGHNPRGPVWNNLVNNGKGKVPAMEWHISSHTNSLVPLFAKGCGAGLFSDYIDGNDPVRGPYVDNTDIGKVIFSLLNHPPVADAGEDRTVYADTNNIARAALDGNDSYDDDGDNLTYQWSWTIDGNSCEANGVTAEIELPAGEHNIRLVVNDTFADSCPDETVITVVGPVRSNLRLLPRRLNRQSHNSKVLAILRLPAGIGKDQIDANQPMLLYPPKISPASQYAFQSDRNGSLHSTIFAFFYKSDITKGITEDGPVELRLTGRLTSGQYFYGSDEITIAPQPPRRWWRRNFRSKR